MSLVELFKDWVAEQPPETTIDHHTYDTCALGSFAYHYNRNEHINHDADVVDGYDVASSLSETYGRDAFMIIGNGGVGSVFSKRPHVPMANYGELSVWLNSLEPVVTSV